MPGSLVARLSLLVALIIGLAFALLATILFRSTSVAYVRTTEVVGSRSPTQAESQAVLAAANAAYNAEGRSGLQRLADAPQQFGLPSEVAFLIVDPSYAVIASTETVLLQAAISAVPPDGLQITVSHGGASSQAEVQLSTLSGAELRDAGGTLIGQLLLLPGPLDDNPGDSFARGVWRSAAQWLLVVIGISMLMTALTLRWFLRPIDQLTGAAQTLVEGGQPLRMALSGHAEIDRLISAFNAAATAIAQTEAMRRQLISDIAHELRTPITNLKAQLEAAEAGLINTDGELLATLQAESQLLAELVEDFQQLALSDAGQLRLSLEALPLLATLQAIVAPMAQRASAQCRIAIDEHLQVQADAHRLRQVIGNLVENACRHRREGLLLSLTAERVGAKVLIRIADNGPGIAAVDQPHVFERFYRAEKSRNRASGGAGLGLTIAKALIEAMDGRVRLLPSASSGAVFEIELPVASSNS